MKKISFLISMLLLATLFACQEQTLSQMKVVKDCTGTYLRWNNRDYHVCNTEKTDNIADGTSVKAAFEKTSGCKNEAIVCMMLHGNEGWIEIKQIKQ